jgi:hypothetical protein
MPEKENCFDYFECKEYECSIRKKPDLNCWDIDDINCKSHGEQFEILKKTLASKIEACKLCIFYQRSN